MQKIVVSDELCIGCGACMAIDPEHFEFTDDGLSEVKHNDNLESKSLIEAIESCPTSAISMTEEENKEENCDCEDCDCEDCDCEHEKTDN